MSEREVLIGWLSQVARRLRLNSVLQGIAAVTCWLLGIVMVHRLVDTVIPYPEASAALLPFLLLGCVGVVAFHGWRSFRRPTLIHAASEADRRIRLRDQVKSAYWFSTQPVSSPAVELVLRHASQTARGLDPRVVIPLTFPRGALGAAGLALTMGLLVWWSPHATYSVKNPSEDYVAARLALTGKDAKMGASEGQRSSGEGVVIDKTIAALSAGYSSTSPTQQSTKELVEAGTGALEEANADSQTRSPEDKEDSIGKISATRRAKEDLPEMPSEWLGSVIARIKDMMQGAEDSSPRADLDPEGKARGDPARVTAGNRDRPYQIAPREEDAPRRMMTAPSTSDLRANPLGGIGPRNAVSGEGEGIEQEGHSNSNSGAMGQRVGTSRAGAGDGNEAPRGNPEGDSDSTLVLGRKTKRLGTQLQRLTAQSKDSGDRGEQDEGSQESVFSSTRSQAARVELRDVNTTSRPVSVDALNAQETPLAYRGVVRDYFLAQHRKEK